MNVMTRGPSVPGRQDEAHADRRQMARGRVRQDLRNPQSGHRRNARPCRRRRCRGHRPRRRRRTRAPSTAPGASSSPRNGSDPAASSPIWWSAISRNSPRSTRSTWARRSPAPRGNRQRALGMLRFYAGMATALHGETIENSLPGEYRVLHAEGAGRRGRRDHPLERPADRVDLEDRSGAGDRLHGGAEARRGGAADPAAPGRTVPGGRRAARRGERRARLRRDRRRRAGRRIRTSTRWPSPART